MGRGREAVADTGFREGGCDIAMKNLAITPTFDYNYAHFRLV